MPGPESNIPDEWYRMAAEDVMVSQTLFKNAPQLQASIVFHLQQAVEKYLMDDERHIFESQSCLE